MYQSQVRSTTANTGKTVLAIVAILSLLLSFFAMTQPVAAEHGGAHLQEGQQGTAFDDAAQNANCPASDLTRIEPGETLWHFVLTQPASDEGTITATFERADGSQFTVSMADDDSDANVLHFYIITTDAVALVDAQTDIAGGNLVLSHICNEAPVEGSLIVLKTDDQDPATPLEGAEFTVDGVTQATGADGTTCFDNLVAGDSYDVTETTPPTGYEPADPATQSVVAGSGACADRTDGPDVTFTNALIPGSLIVLKTDDQDPATPLEGAEFTVDGVTQATGADGTTCFDNLVAGDSYDVTETTPPTGYEPADPATQSVVAGSGACADRTDGPDVTFTNAAILGSITVVKEVEQVCEECDTRTRGFYFNTAGQHSEEFDAAFGDSVTVGDFTFNSAADVNAFESGISPQIDQLVVQYLTALINAFRCEDLLSQELNGTLVSDILDDALAVIEDPTAFSNDEVSALIESLTTINESGEADENPLTCSDEPATGAEANGFEFTLTDENGDEVSGTTGDDGDGMLVFSDLPFGTYTLVETGGPGEEECSIVSATGDGVSFDPETGVITIVIDDTNTDVTVTVVNECGETPPPPPPGGGTLELEKFFCPADEDGTQFIVTDPAHPEDLRVQAEEEPEGCTMGDATFEIENTETGDTMSVSTGADGMIEVDLADGTYTITETSTDEEPAPSATFTIEDGAITAVIVINSVGEEEEQGQIKIIKLFCEADTDSVTFTIEGGNELPPSLENCELGDAAFRLNDGNAFTLGSDGILFANVDAGSYTLTEISPNSATSPSFDVEVGEITTVIVVNNAGGGTGGEEMVEVSIMKHLCGDISSVEEFEAVEDAGVAGLPGGQGTLSGLAATVLACPAIVLTGDVPTSGAVSGGNIDFDFSVIDSDGTQVLSSDGAFQQAALCESAVDVDVNEDGDKADCLDTSHYMFDVVDGVVVITETDAPDGSTGVGTLRFTPGSEDETALVGTIGSVEASGVIVLDTTKASETALEDGIMLHVYNFAEVQGEGTEGNQGGPKTGEGTLAGQLPNTATEPFNGTSVPVALVALLMLSGLGAAAYAMKAEAARRR